MSIIDDFKNKILYKKTVKEAKDEEICIKCKKKINKEHMLYKIHKETYDKYALCYDCFYC